METAEPGIVSSYVDSLPDEVARLVRAELSAEPLDFSGSSEVGCSHVWLASRTDLRAHAQAAFSILDRSVLPIIIYNFPQATGYDIPAEVVIELAGHPNIAAIKESSGNLDKVKAMVEGTRQVKRQATVTETFEAVTPRMLKAAAAESEKQSRELVSVASLTGSAEATAQKSSSSAVTVIGKLKTRQKEVGFQVMVGAAHQLEPSLGLGAVGAILAFACPAPMACYEIYAALKDGDTALAREKQERVKLAAQRVVGDLGVPGVKYSMDLNGYYGGPSRLPFLPLSGDQKAEIEKLMDGIKS